MSRQPIIVRLPNTCKCISPFMTETNIEIPDYGTAIALARAIEDAAEAYLRDREEAGE